MKMKIYVVPALVDGENVTQIKIELLALIQGGARKVICDFSRTEVLSPRAIKIFADAGKMLMNLRGELGICWARPHVPGLFSGAGGDEYVKFYDLEESINISAMYVLVQYFDRYEDIREITTRRDGQITIIEIKVLFASTSTMGEVQETMDVIQQEIETKIKDSRVVIIANAYPCGNSEDAFPQLETVPDSQ